MIDIEAEARAIHKGKAEAWDAAVAKLTGAWESDDPTAIAAWQAVFGRYQAIANRSRRADGFFDLHIFMEAGNYAGGFDPRPDPPLSAEEEAALAADNAKFQAECEDGLHDPNADRDPNLDEDIPF